eukprot:11169908-Lingulodinium_polyedra.AAC.1
MESNQIYNGLSGLVWSAWPGLVRPGLVRPGLVWPVWSGIARPGLAWSKIRLGQRRLDRPNSTADKTRQHPT